MNAEQSVRSAVIAQMQHRGMSRRRLARETGLAKETVGAFLDGTAETRRASVVAICVHLGLPVPPVDQEAQS